MESYLQLSCLVYMDQDMRLVILYMGNFREKNMNQLKIITKIIIFIIIGILIFSILTCIIVPKTKYEKFIKGFYEEPENSLDVVFVGDSSIYKGISPIEIWKEYKITSYNFATPDQKMWDSYYSIKEILDYQKPEVIVLNAEQVFSKKPTKEAYKRHLYDNIKFGKNKLEAITDKVQKNKRMLQFSFLFPLLRFHSRWNSLTSEDFQCFSFDYHSFIKGYYYDNQKKPWKQTNYMNQKRSNEEIQENALVYLEKIKQLCDEKGVKLVLMQVPIPTTWNEKKHEQVQRWAVQNHVPFVDMNESLEQLKMDWEKDTCDKGKHLNINGAKKASQFIGKYLKENYTFTNAKRVEIYQQWEKDTEQYESFIREKKK